MFVSRPYIHSGRLHNSTRCSHLTSFDAVTSRSSPTISHSSNFQSSSLVTRPWLSLKRLTPAYPTSPLYQIELLSTTVCNRFCWDFQLQLRRATTCGVQVPDPNLLSLCWLLGCRWFGPHQLSLLPHRTAWSSNIYKIFIIYHNRISKSARIFLGVSKGLSII